MHLRNPMFSSTIHKKQKSSYLLESMYLRNIYAFYVNNKIHQGPGPSVKT